MPPFPTTDGAASRPADLAFRALWKRVVLGSLAGIFLAELFVMLVLGEAHRHWGIAFVDAGLLTLLVLPGLHLLVLRPLGDMSARLAAASADARFRAVVDTTGDAVVVSDRAGGIRYMNPAALSMLGYAAAEVEGGDLALLEPQERRRGHADGPCRYVLAGGASLLDHGAVEREALARDGTRIPVEVTVSAPNLREDGVIVTVMRDTRWRRRLGLYEALLLVCCICGSIRDDGAGEGNASDWGSLEDFVARRASAQFSHTFCPGCLEKYRREQGLAPAVVRRAL